MERDRRWGKDFTFFLLAKCFVRTLALTDIWRRLTHSLGQVWLEERGFKNLVKIFVKNGINGEALATISDAELVAIKVDKLGDRKGLLKAVSELTAGKKSAGGGGGGDDQHSQSSSKSQSSNTKSSQGGLNFKVKVTDGSSPDTQVALNPDGSVSLGKLFRKVERVVGFSQPILTAVLADGREVNLEEQADWSPLWAMFSRERKPFSFTARKAGVNEIKQAERGLLDSLVDSAVVADTKMTILFVNKMLTKLTGYTPAEVVGKNVQMLMPAEVAKHHESYVNSYLTTGQAKVIGKGRQVLVRRKDGSTASCWLSVTEQKKASGRHTFLGTLHEVATKMRSDTVLNFAVLDAIQKVCIVIDPKGEIKFMNRHAEGLLGWNEEAVGQNIRMLMPHPYSTQHDSYLANYMKSGQAKIIGKGGRTVLAQRKDGSVVAVEISIDEVSLSGERHFVGTLKEMSSAAQETRSILQDTRGVINSLAMPAVVIDKTGRIQGFNAMAETLLGYSMVDVLGEKVQMLMNDNDAAKHDSYISNYLRSGVAKVIGMTRNVLAKTVDGALLPIQLSVSQTINPDDPEDMLFTGMLVPVHAKAGDTTSESTSYGAAERNYMQMNSAGENTIKSVSGVKDFGAAEDANPTHRSAMEDAWIVMDKCGGKDGDVFFGVYDGHNGPEAAEFAMSKLHLFLIKAMQREPATPLNKQLEKSYLAVHEAMGSEIGTTGCTAVTVYLQQQSAALRTLHVANVGDSRAVLLSGGKAVRLTKDHKPSDPEEKKAIEAKGGMVFNGRVSGILGVSRSLGDYRAEKYISRVPSYTSHPIASKDQALVIACDGLFDVCSDQEVMDLVAAGIARGHSAGKTAEALCRVAIEKGTTDNVTVMVVVL